MSHFSPVKILLMRENENDDVILISCPDQTEDVFEVTYNDTEGNFKFCFKDEWENVKQYLMIVFDLLAVDKRPFTGVQFNIPAFPCIVLSVKNTVDPEKMSPVWWALESLLSGWPLTLKQSKKSRCTSDDCSTSYDC